MNTSNRQYDGLAEVVRHYFQETSYVETTHDGACVTTHCLYPSNGAVRVTVRGGNESVIISDNGGALSEAASAGIQTPFSDRALTNQITDQGLKVANGHIISPRIPLTDCAVGILLVANASKDVAQWCYDHARIKSSRDFKKLLAEFLHKRFVDSVNHDAVIVGATNKAHKFANVIILPQGRRLIVDPVVNDPSSINARVIANLDVKSSNDNSIIQRIVYDDAEMWSPADLNLLNVGATPVPFSRSSEVIERIAASAG